MTMGEFEDLCVRVQREYGDAFPLSRLTDAGGISAVVDPLTSRCFLLLEDGLATISIFYDFEGADNVPWVARPGDYFMCDTGDVQAELTSAREAACEHLVRVAELSGLLRAMASAGQSVARGA